MITWIVEVRHEDEWLPSMDTIPHDTRDEARKSARFLSRINKSDKYRVSKYVRAD